MIMTNKKFNEFYSIIMTAINNGYSEGDFHNSIIDICEYIDEYAEQKYEDGYKEGYNDCIKDSTQYE